MQNILEAIMSLALTVIITLGPIAIAHYWHGIQDFDDAVLVIIMASGYICIALELVNRISKE